MDKYILITGGELFNKGAQAMTYVTVNEIYARWPEKKIVLLSSGDAKRDESFLSNLTFDVIPSLRVRDVVALRLRALQKKRIRKDDIVFQKLCLYFDNADALLDISGYALGSNWGADVAFSYLIRIIAAKGYHIPVYLLSQSFGPFEYTGWKKIAVNLLSRHYLKYCKIIMAREEEGRVLLQNQYKLKNVLKTDDIVLESIRLNPDKIYKNIPIEKDIQIDNPSIAIIPNKKNMIYMQKHDALALYQTIVERVLQHGIKIYLIYHAMEDQSICREIKAGFADNENVIVVENELNCFEFNKIIGQFRFIIASRYHSIVNAYRNGISALVIGWATKYKELLEVYHQEQFQLDVRNGIERQQLINALETMIKSYKENNTTIQSVTSQIQQQNVFDLIHLN